MTDKFYPLDANSIPLQREPGPPWQLTAGDGVVRSTHLMQSGDTGTLILQIPDDSSLPSSISIRLKAFVTSVNSSFQVTHNGSEATSWFTTVISTVDPVFNGDNDVTVTKASAVNVRFHLASTLFDVEDEEDPVPVSLEVSIIGYLYSGGKTYWVNHPITILP